MKRNFYLVFVLLLTTYCSCISAQEDQPANLAFYVEETRIQQLQQRESEKTRTEKFAITNVNLIPMTGDEKILPDMTVLVSNGKIESVRSGDPALPSGYQIINGKGKFLIPGLTDMHVHNLVSSSQHLLNLCNGVTTVRDMDGFPWMLKVRDQISNNRLLAPNLYMTGHILNSFPMGMYATIVKSAEQAREIVKQQKAHGYDFIKIHNRLPLEIVKAISEQAAAEKIDFVGHIPHELTVKQAVQLKMRTLEHFKGYILDSGLVLTKEDYLSATRGAQVWNTPTFYNYRSFIRGNQAKKFLNESNEMKYVSRRDKKDWMELAEKTDEKNLDLQRNVFHLSKKIMKDLIPSGAQFLAGTDSGGGYPFMVPGFSLQEELTFLQEAGLSPYETLKTATVNAAEAMRKQKEFGTIEVGKRADLLLLRSNPLEDVKNASSIEGVSVRGRWLSRQDLDAILKGIEEIYSVEYPEPSDDAIRTLIKEMTDLQKNGFVFRTHDIQHLSDALKKRGMVQEAGEVSALQQ